MSGVGQNFDNDEPSTIRFRVAGSIELVGDAWGDPENSPVLLLHGGGQTRHAWAGTAAILARGGWYAIVLDQRGHGESDWDPDGNYERERYADDVIEVAAELSQPPVLVGASLGGMASLMAIHRAHRAHPPKGEIARALILVDIATRMESEGLERIFAFMQGAPDGFANLEEAADAVAAYNPHRPRPTDLGGLKKNLREGADGRWRWHWDPAFVNRARGQRMLAEGVQADEAQTFLDGEALMDAARSLSLPVLLVRGKASDVVSADGADDFLAAVPQARYADVAGAGHMVAGDRNDAFNDAVLEFLRHAFA